MTNIDTIKKLAYEFRMAIEKLTPEDLDPKAKDIPKSGWFNSFPKGCCGDTAQLLFQYFKDDGIMAKYISSHGIREKYINQTTHAWIEYNDYIIDITADQFENFNDKVIVTKDKTWWYSIFEVQGNGDVDKDIEKEDKYNKKRLRYLYDKIISKI